MSEFLLENLIYLEKTFLFPQDYNTLKKKLGIKIVNEGGKIKAKGSPVGSKIGYFFGVLFFLAGFFMVFWNILAIFLIIIAIIMLIASALHTKNARIKKLREAGYDTTFEEEKRRKIRRINLKYSALIFVVIFLIIMGFLILGVVTWGQFNKQQQMINRGCIPLTFNSWGLATSWTCP